MFVFGDRVVCSAVDLVRAAHCEFALLRALDAELGTIPAESDAIASPTARATAENSEPGVAVGSELEVAVGSELEVAVGSEPRLTDYRAHFGTSVVEIVRPHDHAEDPAERATALAAAHTATVTALYAGAPVIGHPTFYDGRFHCSCDFLVRAQHRPRYTAHGSATTMSDQVSTALELAACAEAVGRAGAQSAVSVRLHLGARSSAQALRELLPVHRARRRRVEHIIEMKLAELLPVQWGDPRFLACGHCHSCVAALTAARDLLLVAGMPLATRTRLRAAGVGTIDRLVALHGTVPGVPVRTLAALRRQAHTQLEREIPGKPAYTLANPIALRTLPPPSVGDLSLTIAADEYSPLTVEIGGLDTVHLSLHGPSPTSDDPEHVVAQERRLLEQVLDYLTQRRRLYPDLHIYHYTSVVRTTLAHRTGRCGVDEQLLDEVLGTGAFIDLYPIVRNAVLVGESSYDLGQLRRLFSATALPSGATSDCRAVLWLRDWLLDRAVEHGVTPHGDERQASAATVLGESRPAPSCPSALEAALAEYAATHGDPLHPAAMMAATLGYHRREWQTSWWAHVDRLMLPAEEWADTPGVLLADTGAVDTTWHHRPGRAAMRRYLTLVGRIGAGHHGGPAAPALAPGAVVYTCYDRRGATHAGMSGDRHVTAEAIVLGCSTDTEFDDTVRLEELLPVECDPYDDLPFAIMPGLPARNEHFEAAIEHTAHRLLATLPTTPHEAIFDILARRAPRLHDGAPLPEVHGDHAAAIGAAVGALDRSYLAVQAGPGTGKTTTAARVLQRLLTHRKWRIGVVAPEDATVENLLDAAVGIGVLPELVAKRDPVALAPEWAVIDTARYRQFLHNAINGCILGGTPSDFADENVVARASLDLLVVADAGHFAVAGIVAVAASARNLLLLGDLAPSPAHGAHPAPVDESVLGWLAAAGHTVPAERGYFLDRTWRMHPAVCAPLSRLYYDGRLRSNETVTLARDLDGAQPGVRTVLVDHFGNSTSSPDEAREVVRRVRTLLTLSWSAGTTTRKLHPHDIFVIAPFAAQVGRIRNMLTRAKIEDVLVGTPDRFRGREAAVVLLSMTSSSSADAPAGMPALLTCGLLQAALSRAMWQAIIIRSPLLTEYLPATTAELSDLGTFLRLSGDRE
ncbi:AAA domain-containing protein [Nocardia sp. CNY236]|uniref:AAA domain-containing protein n=1 Tax=Nocardia sp. CNY236 TaxID=1169152 RepID=UPI0003F6479F|nr:AAA domain-containing protein [Nocardia sp. CNY236]